MNCIRMTAIAFALLAYGADAGAVESASAAIRGHAPKGITEAFYACIDKADYNAIAVAACLTQEEQRQDDRLNATYKALLDKLDKNQRKDLVEAERAWLEFRDRTVVLEDALYGDEAVDNLQLSQDEIFALCERADELEKYLAIANGL